MKDVTKFLKEVQLELGKIVWPSANELVGLVAIVMILVCILSVYVGFIDVIFYKIAGRIF